MLVSVISGPSYQEIEEQCTKSLPYAEVLEFRFDQFYQVGFDDIQTLRKKIGLPVIFTYSKNPSIGKESRISKLKKLIELQPDYIDLDLDVDPDLDLGNSKVIRSYHNFSHTPEDLKGLLQKMERKQGDVYKICCFAKSSLDALRMLSFVLEQKKAITGICMGPLGQVTRILGPVVGNMFDYGVIEKSVAPGQLTLKELCDVYRYKDIGRETKVYALLGDPVDKSIGHIFHNQIFSLKGVNNIYVKIALKAFELASFFEIIKSLPFQGFSVTMPLKKEVFPYMDFIESDAQKMRSINTIKWNGKWHGSNTDGQGALLAIKEHLDISKKKALVLGAGGASRAIVYKLLEAKASVCVVNRTLENAKALEKEYGCLGYSVDSLMRLLKEGVDLIINTTPDTSFFIHMLKSCKNRPLIMEIISNPVKTDFILEGIKLGFPYIYGYEMFIHQGVLQQTVFNKALLDIFSCSISCSE